MSECSHPRSMCFSAFDSEGNESETGTKCGACGAVHDQEYGGVYEWMDEDDWQKRVKGEPTGCLHREYSRRRMADNPDNWICIDCGDQAEKPHWADEGKEKETDMSGNAMVITNPLHTDKNNAPTVSIDSNFADEMFRAVSLSDGSGSKFDPVLIAKALFAHGFPVSIEFDPGDIDVG